MTKKIRIFLSVLVVTLILAIIPAYAMANVKTVNYEGALLQEGRFDIEKSQMMSIAANEPYDLNGLRKFLYDEMIKCTERIYIDNSQFQVSLNDICPIVIDVINDNPDLFYISSTVSARSNYFDKNTNYVDVQLVMPKEEIESAKVIFNDGTQKALKKLDAGMNDMQKALVLHDYILDNATYERPGEIAHSAYGFFKDGKVVCAGYSLAYSYLLNQAGIRCEFVTSSKMEHAWNIVLINGNWYNADLTYDDICAYNKGENIRGAYMHTHFLKSDKYFQSVDGGCHYGYLNFDEAVADDLSLDNYFWDDITTNIPVVNGEYYYLDPDANKYLTFKKIDTNGNESIVYNQKFSGAVFTLTSPVVDEQGNQYNVEYLDYLVRLTYLDNRFYIAYFTKLKSVFPNGDAYDICDLTNYPIGMGTENGNIVYQPYQTYTPIILDKFKYLNDCFYGNNSTNYNNYADIHYDKVINTKDFALYQNTDY